MNVFPFDGKSKEQKIKDAKSLLEDNGYFVSGPLLHKSNVKGPSDLVKFFYDRMAQYNPDLLMYYSSSNSRDLAIAKELIEARQKIGSGIERAIVECCALIDVLFRYERYVGLSFKITSMSVLNIEWVVHKLTDIINGLNGELSSAQDEKWFDKLYKEQEDNIPEELIFRSNKRLGLEDEDGKKEG